MEPSLTDRLCTHCALCCDGSLFADVELVGPEEAMRVEAMGLEVDDSDGSAALLVQPCRALQGKRCGVYAYRPRCCRTFECGLLQDVRRGAVGVEQAEAHIADALGRIARVRKLLAPLEQRASALPLKERVAEAVAQEVSGASKLGRKRAELAAAMSSAESLIGDVFLGGRRKARPNSRTKSG
jgi:hypothetical protein